MRDIDDVIAAEAIRNLQGRYCIAVDTKDRSMFASLFAHDATVDFSGAQIDPNQPNAGRPDAIREILRGPEQIADRVMAAVANLVTVHHCSIGEIVIESAETARATWPVADRLRFPPGGKVAEVSAFGYYHGTYVKHGGEWKIHTLTMSRLRIDNIAPS